MIYYLVINVIGQESQNGTIVIPPSQLPPIIEAPTPEQAQQITNADQFFEHLRSARERFLSGKMI